MKEFLVYTGLRIVLFLASFGVVVGIWSLATGGKVPVFWTLVLALAISGVLSYYLLNRQRSAFAERVEERASRASAAFEAHKAREDEDAAAGGTVEGSVEGEDPRP